MPDQVQSDSDTEAQANQVFAAGLHDSVVELPARPQVTARMSRLVEDWWKRTNDVPEFRKAVAEATNCQKTLTPALFDREDPFRGGAPPELKNRQDHRRVRINYAYRNVQQIVAMLLPDDHTFHWEPKKEIGADPEKPDELLTRLSATLEHVQTLHLDEINWTDVVQGWGMDMCTFRMATLKVTYDSGFVNSVVHATDEGHDKQKMIQKLRTLAEDYARNLFGEQDGRFQQMMDLKESLGIEGELQFRSGIRIENVPIDCLRFSSTVRDFDRIYLSPWISQDARMGIDDIREQYPYVANDDGTWTGVHPQDLEGLVPGVSRDRNKTYGDTFWTSQTSAASGNAAQASPNSEAQSHQILVREIWSRADGRVFVFVEGVPYPVMSWVPERTPSQWYPFHFARLNRLPGTPYGISDVELMKDIQDRINSKKSDEERARWLSIERYAYNKGVIDDDQIIKLQGLNPGDFVGINIQGAAGDEKLTDHIFPIACKYTPEAYETEGDEQDMRQMANIPEQMTGVTGTAKFAAEVTAAQAGAATASKQRARHVKRALERIYTSIAEILLQEEVPANIKKDCGPSAFWPVVYGEAEGKKLYEQIVAQAQEELQQQDLLAAAQAAHGGMPPSPPNPDQHAAALQVLIEQKCIQTFGFPEPVTRETLFRRLHCTVTVALDAAEDNAEQTKTVMGLCQAMNEGGQAAQASGTLFNPDVILKMLDMPELDGLFTKTPQLAGSAFAAVAQKNPGPIDPQLAMQIAQIIAPALQQAAQQAAAGAAGPGGPGPQGPPQPGPGAPASP